MLYVWVPPPAPRPIGGRTVTPNNDQSYYRTPEWQAGEAESLAERDAGRTLRFASAEELVAWLQTDEDETSPDPAEGAP